ncbi:acyl-CoA dehydrogenase family protein [Thermoleophilum album]|uniref:acyl-CoA dehydrogenase family protein n=1 Tax=Thermoleophilum album TaxID=29539 RepID=UPI00237C63C6|nr:acyl-CoA dehydrogenase family protein [Thermoleophilum album]WDT94062.1 acyl-CoA dehydrogenase family protein [Thermoleophilum album]
MHFELTDEQRAIRALAREFAEQEVRPLAPELDEQKRFPYELVAKLADLGLMGVPYPQEWGGGGADTLSYALVIEELARVDASLAITVAAHTSLGTYPIYAYGTTAQKERWLPDLCSGRRLAAFGLTEPEAGSDAGNTRTTGRLENGEWVIDGAKQFITNAGTEISALVTITARTGPDEISNIVVPNGTPGYTIGPPYRKMGWNASDTRPLAFDGARVPEDHLLGERGAGFRQFLATLDGGRISVSALAVGLAQGAFDEALAYARERQAFGKPISKFQAIQMKLADISAEIEAARLLTYKAAVLKDQGKPFTLAAAQAKLKSGRVAVRACEEAVQIHGGYGYIEEYPVCRYYRDAKILTIGEGTDEVQQLVIARALGC